MVAKRGRKSAAATEITLLTGPKIVEAVQRIQPPYNLIDEEAEVWVAVTESMPADWFSNATAPILAQYCKHVVQSKRVSELLEKATGDKSLTLEDYDRLLKMQERESRAISSLATKMRISQQATTNHRGNKQAPSPTKRPWEA